MKLAKEILDVIRKNKRFLITTHARCDGDALGSELALAQMLRLMKKSASIINTGGTPKELLFMPWVKKVRQFKPGTKLNSNYDVIIVLDSGGLDRLEELAEPIKELIRKGTIVINIDHHQENDLFGDINWTDPSRAASGEIVYQIILASGVKIDKNMATNIYVSLDTDTGHFVFSSTTPESHYIAGEMIKKGIDLSYIFNSMHANKSIPGTRLYIDCLERIKLDFNNQIAWSVLTRQMYKKFKTEPADSQEYLSVLRAIKDVKVALLFRESHDNPLKIKLSVRAKPPINADRLMAHFGGGGHNRAAGATLKPPMDKAIKKVIEYIKGVLKNKTR
ncbi:MAG: bifunctional oligoribonuclease/PAP phosphatase NrnA [Candidatus Brocadiia bacterium]